MYCVKRTTSDGSLAYYTYDGWLVLSAKSAPLDLSDVVLFTEREAQMNGLPSNEEFQWYGAYKR